MKKTTKKKTNTFVVARLTYGQATHSRKAASSAGVDEFCDPGGVGVEAINVKERRKLSNHFNGTFAAVV